MTPPPNLLPRRDARQRIVDLGDFLFRWRSYLPLLLLPIVIVAVARSQYPFGQDSTDLAWEIACVLVSFVGFALRVYTVGVVPPGTSGRNTREQKAASLNTTGPYSVVRHPLYVANFIIVLGLSLFTHAWILPPAVAILTFAYYACIAQREEAFLLERFGSAFERWASRVPAVLPAFSGYVRADRPFAWRVALRREFYALTLILTTPFFLDIIEDLNKTGTFDLDVVWTIVGIVGVVLFVVVRFLKKHTALLAVPRVDHLRP
jgi:protein-S-isoprenylcysteine O-methyltransferase Ste14